MSRPAAASEPAGPARTVATVVETRPAGAYRHLVLSAPGLGQGTRPGQFVALATGGPTSATLLRRAFSVYRVAPSTRSGEWQLEIVLAPHGPGTHWLAERRPGDQVDVVGPLGKPFPLLTEPLPCVLVGGGYGSAPLFWLAETLRDRGCQVDLVLGAASRDRLFGVEVAAKVADAVVVTTDDGSAGVTGRVSDVLPEVITGARAAVVYACGPMPMLRAVAAIAAEHGAVAQLAVEEAMACGIGVCMTCVLPVADRSGKTSMVRSCVEGPVFRGDRIRWEAFVDGWTRVPEDCLGAPTRREGGV